MFPLKLLSAWVHFVAMEAHSREVEAQPHMVTLRLSGAHSRVVKGHKELRAIEAHPEVIEVLIGAAEIHPGTF
jgi:hypothetical protein